jgi:cysteine-rich repeat protein
MTESQGVLSASRPSIAILGEIETGRCGNGIVDPGEECDDGNLLFGAGQYGDGCDPSCRRERIGCFL